MADVALTNMTADQAADIRLLLYALGWPTLTIQDWLFAGWRVRYLSQVPTGQIGPLILGLCDALHTAVDTDAGITAENRANAEFDRTLPPVDHDAAPITQALRVEIDRLRRRFDWQHTLHWENFIRKYSSSPITAPAGLTVGQAHAVIAELERRLAVAAGTDAPTALDGPEQEAV